MFVGYYWLVEMVLCFGYCVVWVLCDLWQFVVLVKGWFGYY